MSRKFRSQRKFQPHRGNDFEEPEIQHDNMADDDDFSQPQAYFMSQIDDRSKGIKKDRRDKSDKNKKKKNKLFSKVNGRGRYFSSSM